MEKDLGHIRSEYSLNKLEEGKLPVDPITLFNQWLDDARNSVNPEPTAMTLSTLERNGQPSSRIVLLKKIESEHFIFFTNYKSRKASEINKHIRVSALFFWPELQRHLTKLPRRNKKKCELIVALGETHMQVAKIKSLKVGDIIPTNRLAGEFCMVMCNGSPTYRAEPVVADGILGVRIMHLVKQGSTANKQNASSIEKGPIKSRATRNQRPGLYILLTCSRWKFVGIVSSSSSSIGSAS